ALVAQGSDRVCSNPPPSTFTDDQGRYRFANVAPGSLVLTVAKDGYAPDLVSSTAAPGMQPIDFVLGPASTFRFRIVDEQGEPLPGVHLYADTWRGCRTLDQGFRADAQGRATWLGPADAVTFHIYGRDLARQELSLEPSDPDDPEDAHRIVMAGPRALVIQATDIETGSPVSSFSVIRGQVLDARAGRVFWSRGHDDERASGGVWQGRYFPGRPWTRYRIEAHGYKPLVFEPSLNGQDVSVSLELTPAKPLEGRLVDGAGSPAAGVTVHLMIGGVGLRIDNGRVIADPDAPRLITDGDGRLALPPLDEDFLLVVAHDAGYLEADANAFAQANGRLALQPWGRIEGRVTVGDQPGAGERVAAWLNEPHHHDELRLHHHFGAAVQADGSFVFDRVPPGKFAVGRVVAMGPSMTGYTHAVRCEVESGGATSVAVGGGGRPVVGRIAWPDPDDERSLVHGHRSIQLLHEADVELEARMSELLPEGFDLWDAQRRQDFAESDEGKALQEQIGQIQAERRGPDLTLAFAIDADGGFRVENVPPGEYTLSVAVSAPPEAGQCGFGATLGHASHRFTVPALPDGVGYLAEPLDLGVHTVEAAPTPLRSGSPAPDFTVPLLDPETDYAGENADAALEDAATFTLSDYRGRFVLVDFWAVWCGPCTAETPHLKAVWDAFGGDPRFAMIGLALDPSPEAPAGYARENELGWVQGFLGNWGESQVARDFVLTGIPAIFLIGPDGEVVARDLRGPGMVEQVRQAMGEPLAVVEP
ncbi:MAG: redoxin domain-containing protein, partial [Planctomycetota bacterium]